MVDPTASELVLAKAVRDLDWARQRSAHVERRAAGLARASLTILGIEAAILTFHAQQQSFKPQGAVVGLLGFAALCTLMAAALAVIVSFVPKERGTTNVSQLSKWAHDYKTKPGGFLIAQVTDAELDERKRLEPQITRSGKQLRTATLCLAIGSIIGFATLAGLSVF